MNTFSKLSARIGYPSKLRAIVASICAGVAAMLMISSPVVGENAPFIALDDVITVKLLADGKTIACGRLHDERVKSEADRNVVLVDLLSRKETRAWNANGSVSLLSSLDDGQIVTFSSDRFRFWNPKMTASPREWQMAGTPPVFNMAVAPSGDYLAAATLLRQNVIEVYNLRTNLPVARIPASYVEQLHFSRDSQLLIANLDLHNIGAWEARKFERVFDHYSEDGILAFQASPDSRFLYTVTWDGTVTRTTVSNNENRKLAKLPRITSACISDDGRLVYYSFNGDRDYIFDTLLEKTVREFRVPENYKGPAHLAIPRPSRSLFSEAAQCFVVPKTDGICLLSVEGLAPVRATCP